MKAVSRHLVRLSGAAAIALACLFVAAAPDPASAGKCKYAHMESDDGPCVEVKNEKFWSFGSHEMNLWCMHGSKRDKVILRPSDSFTCPGDGPQDRYDAMIQRTQAGCDKCFFDGWCKSGKTKLTLKKKARGGPPWEFIEQTCE